MIKALFTLTLLCLISSTYAIEKSQCGSTNDRSLSNDMAIGRMLKSENSGSGCTGTLISKTCMISAGHCYQYSNTVEFNTEPSRDGSIVHPSAESIYSVSEIVNYERGGSGKDWMVFRIKPNTVTGQYAGDVQGTYDFTYEVPAAPLDILTIGYGRDSRPEHNYAQQIGYGKLVGASGTLLSHIVDTEGGASGSAIIERGSNKIIGIHTHGGCSYSSNKGTMLATHKNLQKAIETCLKREEQDLH